MKTLKLIISIFFVTSFLFLSACSSDDSKKDGDDAPGNKTGTMTAKVDGKLFTADDAVAIHTFNQNKQRDEYVISGSNEASGQIITFLFFGLTTTGDYAFDDVVATYKPNMETSNRFYDDDTKKSGTFTLSETKIEGTFSFSAKNFEEEFVNITEGKFSAKILN